MADDGCQWVGWNKRQACMRKFGSLDPSQTCARLCQRANAPHRGSHRRRLLRSGTEVDYDQSTARPVARASGRWTNLVVPRRAEANDHAASTHSMHDTGTTSVDAVRSSVRHGAIARVLQKSVARFTHDDHPYQLPIPLVKCREGWVPIRSGRGFSLRPTTRPVHLCPIHPLSNCGK